MRVLLVFCHPVETSYQAALHRVARDALGRAGHEVDDLDLYGEGFEPALSRQERIDYHDTAINRVPVEGYVQRLLAAEALAFCFPVWNFGPPAMLKGFFDRVFLPGVAFELDDAGNLTHGLRHIQKLAAITTYGRTRLIAWAVGDPPRRLITRIVRHQIRPGAKALYLALYDMNKSTQAGRERFLAKVDAAMAGF
jgi:NAD(P)H dehydrogenase (quinone)